MSQIIGGHTFVPLERNIDDVKLNSITGGAVITSELISTQTLSTSAVTGDQFLVLKAGGTLARMLYDDLATSIVASGGMTSAITSVRLRTFNSVGNNTFEVNQRLPTTNLTLGTGAVSGFPQDRWFVAKNQATATYTTGWATGASAQVPVPGTNFLITNYYLYLQTSAVQATPAAGDVCYILQKVEGPFLRELFGDVHSVSVLAQTNVSGGLKFSLSLTDPGSTRSLVKLCTIPANVWTMVQLPNLPIFPSAGNFSLTAGNAGYIMFIVTDCGSTYMAPAADTWQAGNFLGAPGMDSLASKPSGSYIRLAFIQHESGTQCTTPIDKPWQQNYDECRRYYQKSWDYATAVGTGSVGGYGMVIPQSASSGAYGFVPFVPALAKTPALIGYSNATGAANTAVQSGATFSITGPTGSSKGINSLINAGGNFGNSNPVTFQWTADTGW